MSMRIKFALLADIKKILKGVNYKMKKGKVFSKRHIVTAVLTVCLAAAVWLNMKYANFTPSNVSDKDLGNTEFFDSETNMGDAVQTSAGVARITQSRKSRNESRTKIVEEFSKILSGSQLDEQSKSEALGKLQSIAEAITKETAIETVIKSKGFEDALVIISDESVTVIVPKESLLSSETLQIQDAVKSQLEIDLEKIKIISVK